MATLPRYISDDNTNNAVIRYVAFCQAMSFHRLSAVEMSLLSVGNHVNLTLIAGI
jgi:hypothetical protein